MDLAAADGIKHSNSYVLEKLFGWDGLCIEPNPAFYKTLRTKRDCLCDNAVISNERGLIDFRTDNGQLGGIVADDTDNNYEIREDQLAKAEIVSLESYPLIDILKKHNCPKIIDYFSLDVEGAEERIISSFDFSAYKFLSITIERPSPLVNKTLFDNGYVFVKNYKFDSFYIHESIAASIGIECDLFEQIEPKGW